MSNLYRGPSTDASYQVSVLLAMRFQRRRFLRNRPIRNKNCLWWPCLLMNRAKMNNRYREPSIYAIYQVSVHQAMQFQRKIFFRNIPIRNKNCLWQPCLLTNQSEMSKLYRGPSIDASYQVSVHLALQFQRNFLLRNLQFRNKNCLWWPCLLTDRDEMNKRYRGPYIDAAYQVSIHLAEGFQRRRLKCEKFTDR
jgi:Zn-finger protein